MNHQSSALAISLVLVLLAPSLSGQIEFRELRSAIPEGAAEKDVALGDLDGDGDLDAFFGTCGPKVLRNAGNGVFDEVSVASGCYYSPALGDVDGDGDLDVVAVSSGARVFVNDGTGMLTLSGDVIGAAPGYWVDMALLADLRGVGLLDCVTMEKETSPFFPSAKARVSWNDGVGTTSFTSVQLLSLVDPWSKAMVEGDIDGDNDLDLVVTTSSDTNPNEVLRNDGTGVLTKVLGTLPPKDKVEQTVLGDVDGDGDLDAYRARVGPNQLFLNGGAGVFSDASSHLPADPWSTRDAVFLDLEADGDLDVAAIDALPGPHPYANDGAGVFHDVSAQLVGGLYGSYCAAGGDLDGDADVDLIVGMSSPAEARSLYLNDGAGVLIREDGGVPTSLHYKVALGDVDGDGDVDALTCGDQFFYPPPTLRLYRNDLTGNFSDATDQLPLLMESTKDLLLYDPDMDGDLDVFALLHSSLTVQPFPDRLLQNDGTGHFTDVSSQLPAGDGADKHAVAGDFDGDGDEDVIRSEPSELLTNDGTATFTAQPIAVHPTIVGDFLAADFDGNGHLDLMTGRNLYLGDGLGGFSEQPVPAGFETMFVADVDVDGDPDALLSKIYLNDGMGNLALGALKINGLAIAVSDIDGDGDADALDTSGDLHINHPPTGFQEFKGATPVLPWWTGSLADEVAIADLNADGLVDIWRTNGTIHPSVLWFQVDATLARRGPARIGKALSFDVVGTPAAFFAVAYSAAAASVPLPYGTLYLAPSSIAVLGSGLLDGDGNGSLPTSVPNQPSLVGVTVFTQALFLLPWRLSSPESLTFSAL